MKVIFVAFDLDGVIVDTISSWVWVHDHFGVNNDASLEAYRRGEIDDREFMRRDIALWLEKMPDITIDYIKNVLKDIPIINGARETVSALKDKGIRTAIISGGLDIVARRVAKDLGIDYVLSNGLEVEPDGRLTGEGILRVELNKKGDALKRLLSVLDVDPRRVAAVGNCDIDIPMFELCGLSIAFNPEDYETEKAADFVVRSNDLRAILPYIIAN
ncbi:MAG: haloacid dehalogenase [Thermoplasmata archaeon]|nr:MAG: haloacid dehalogenase [Thermoplasmata archaeon]